MWLMTKHGFNSIVRKQSGEFHIRARVSGQLRDSRNRFD